MLKSNSEFWGSLEGKLDVQLTPPTNLSEALIRVLFASATDGIIVIDEYGLILTCNAACERMFGYLTGEIVGKNVKLLVPGPFQNEHDAFLAKFRITGERRITGSRREVSGRHKDQSTFQFCLSVNDGMLDGKAIFVGIMSDLTDHKLDETVRKTEARLRAILEAVPDAIVTIDEQGMVEAFSFAASLLFGYDASAVVGKPMTMLMPSPYAEGDEAHRARYLGNASHGAAGNSRIIIGRRRDGSAFPMELAVGEAIDGGRRIFTGFLRDVTRRNAAQPRLEHLQAELLQVSRINAMGQMTIAIAHELNQPLAAIANYIGAAKLRLDADDPSEAIQNSIEALDQATAQAVRAGTIIRNLRNFIERRELHREREDLGKVVEESLALAFVGAAKRSVNVTLVLDAMLGPVNIDKVQIQQVLLNLIRNGMEAMQSSDRRELLLTTHASEEGFAEVTVEDSGPGISAEVLERLFQPFVTTKEKGMGVGLSICQTIIEAHGGRIWVLRTDAAGTSFRIRLPLAAARDSVK